MLNANYVNSILTNKLCVKQRFIYELKKNEYNRIV